MSHSKILVTGGSGYIGSHTIVDLLQEGFDVVNIDNMSRASALALEGIEKITEKKLKHYPIDLCDKSALKNVFEAEKNITGIIHFAAFKSVPESVSQPLLYYQNNLISLLNLLEFIEIKHINFFVFSSSCSVYGNPDQLPVTEATPLKNPESPYAKTKQIGEAILKDYAAAHPNFKAVILRYFNPVGAHASGKIGEFSASIIENLLPVITQTAIGIKPTMTVHGSDYPTRDGSCLRDYVHVQDIASAHTLALQFLIENKTSPPISIFNLGSGVGVTVLEAIQTFEKISNTKLNYTIGPRRIGDVAAIYADNTKAKNILNWAPKYDLDAMLQTAWQWELNRRKGI